MTRSEFYKKCSVGLSLLFVIFTLLVFTTTGSGKTIVVILWLLDLVAQTTFSVLYFISTTEKKKKTKYDDWGNPIKNEE